MAPGRSSEGLGTQRHFRALLTPKAPEDSAFTACGFHIISDALGTAAHRQQPQKAPLSRASVVAGSKAAPLRRTQRVGGSAAPRCAFSLRAGGRGAGAAWLSVSCAGRRCEERAGSAPSW